MEGSLLNHSGEYFYSIAAAFSCLAYVLRSILWLRIFLVCAALTYIVSGVSLGIASMIGWNSAYLVINLFYIGILLFDKVTISLPRETRGVYQRYFNTMSMREFKKLIMLNGFDSFQDQNIIHEQAIPDRLYLILRGKINIVKQGRVIATLGSGDFIGEMSFISKEPASVSAYADNFVQCAYWTHDDLENLKYEYPSAFEKFITIIGCELVRKLNCKN